MEAQVSDGDFNQEPLKEPEFKLPTKPIGRAGAPALAIVPTDLDSVHRMAKLLLASGMAPYHLKKAEEITIIMMHGLEVGMKPMMAVRRIAVIKGTPTIWGDAVPGLCLSTGELEDWKEYVDGEGDSRTWHCEVKRKGIASYKSATFSVAQAKKADLWDERPLVKKQVWENRQRVWKDNQPNDSPWFKHPERMMTMRARVAFRDIFADVFNGLYIAEELIDKDTVLDESGMRDVTPATPAKDEGWKTVDNPLGDNPKTVEVERRKAAMDRAAQAYKEEFASRLAEGDGEEDRPAEPVKEPLTEKVPDHDPETGEVRNRESEEEQEGREAAAELAQEAPEEAKEEPKSQEATQAATKPKNAPAKPQKAPETDQERLEKAKQAQDEAGAEVRRQTVGLANKAASAGSGSGYFQEAMTTVANAVDPSKLNTWWRGDRQKRLKECSAAELEQLNAVYGDKFVALAAKE